MLDFNELRKDFSGEIVSKDHAHYEELRIVYSANFQKNLRRF